MKQVAALLALVLASVAIAACGGGDDDSTTPATTGGSETTNEAAGGAGAKEEGGGGSTASTLEFEADPGGQLAYTTTEASAKAGKVTIDFNNPQPLPHDVKIESSSGEEAGGTDTISEGSNSATASLKPGTYTFYCSVPGHREAGMEGTLTVK
ncbi:MAG: plastocyanin/azurin family copper-binding protein [Solirubrobacterales bacterium]